jgi:quercetin dioxygenase-like cupin family protein
MEPGSRYGNHRHTQTEELYVLEGSCYCGGRLLGPGDYHRAEAGSIHLDTHTEEGSLMLMIASVQNEMLG